VGEYNLAYNLADIPAVQIGEQIGDVLFPSFSLMPAEERKSALIRSTGLLSLLVFPLGVGLGVLAPTVVRALLPDEWQGVAPMLAILSALSVVRPVGWTVQSYLQASNRPRATMWLGLAKIGLLLTMLFAIGHSTKNPLWACAAVGLAFGAHALASMWTVSRENDRNMDPSGESVTTMGAFFAQCAAPLAATIPMVIAVLGFRELLLPLGVPAGIEMVIELGVGAVAYVAAALTIARTTALDLMQLVQDALQRRTGGGGESPGSSMTSAIEEL
jgi:PST family polysaccharide transporter